MLVLKILTRGHLHGYAIAQLIQQLSDDLLRVEEGSLYPALQRLELNGWIKGEWGLSANNRRARFYKLTSDGRKQLAEEVGPIQAGDGRSRADHGVRLMGRFRRRLRFLLSHSERQRLLWEEMEFHIESMAEDFVAQGMSESEARAAARRKFGNMTQKSEEARGTWMLRWRSDLVQDLSYAFRGMRRDAGFTVFMILIAGLGIGASSTVFSVVNALLLRPLPFRDPGRLVWIANQEWVHSGEQLSGFPGAEPILLRPGGVGRLLWHGRQAADGNGRAGAGDGRCRYAELFPLLGVQPVIGQIVHGGRMPAEDSTLPRPRC